jgi:hypothetical protein
MTKDVSRTKLLLLALAAPFMGAAFCIFLPFIGIALLVWYGMKRVRKSYAGVVEWSQARSS